MEAWGRGGVVAHSSTFARNSLTRSSCSGSDLPPPWLRGAHPPQALDPGSCWFVNWPLYMEGKKRPKKEADYTRLVGGRFSKQGDLFTRLVLGGHRQVDLRTCLPDS